MKAEERHHLQQNTLYEFLKRVYAGLQHGSRSMYTWIFGVALLLVLIFGYRYYSAYSLRKTSERWVQLDQADSLEALEKLAESDRGGRVGQIALLQKARYLSGPEGLDRLATLTNESKLAALANIEKARSIYLDLIKEFRKEPILAVQVHFELAKAEEALIGAPKADTPSETRGSITQAITYYRDTASKFPDTEIGKLAERRAGELENNREGIEKFYGELYRSIRETPAPKPEPKPEPKVEPKAEPKTEPKAESKTPPKVEPNVESKAPPKVEPKAEPKVEPNVESKTPPKVEPKVEPRAEPKVEPKAPTKN
jgi:hypothetical protein